MPPVVVMCSGSWSPCYKVCEHLLDETSSEWILVPLAPGDIREIAGDYVCPKCFKRGVSVDDLFSVCMHCTRALRAELDPKYVTFEL